jgi:hypothetical protein
MRQRWWVQVVMVKKGTSDMARIMNRRIGMGLWGISILLVLGGGSGMALAQAAPPLWFVQMPYEFPPEQEYAAPEAATPAPDELSDQDRERLDSLVPLLEGRQEFWAMGEFVHYKKHSIPFLIKALSMPGERLRYNAIETLSMIKDPTSVPALLERATDQNEIPRIRAHAIRVATRLDPLQVVPAIAAMVKDENSTVRSTAVFAARNVPLKEILPIIISVIPDPVRFVGITARDSFWLLTRFGGSVHNWEASTQEDREEWVKEWWDWWEEFDKKEDGKLIPRPDPGSSKKRSQS